MVAVMAPKLGRDERTEQIRRAVVPVFAANGYRGSSMAKLAAAAGVSRPALYQYFDDRADLFRAAIGLVIDEASDAALRALAQEGSVAERLDGFLQRYFADGYAALAGTPYGQELLEARVALAEDLWEAARLRASDGLRAFVSGLPDVEPSVVGDVVALLLLAPGGLKSDRPSPEVFRRRLHGLAVAAAQMLTP